MKGCHLISPHVVFAITCFGLTSGQSEQRIGICAGTSHTFGLKTFGCQNTYSLLNVTLQRRHSPCDTTTVLHSGATDGREECYNHYMEVVLKGITNSVTRCQYYCDADFNYPLYPRISHVSGCCEGKEPPCSFDQMWLYYVCDLPRTTETTPYRPESTETTWTSSRMTTTEGPRKVSTDVFEPHNNSCYARDGKYNHEYDPIIYGTLCAVIGVLSLAIVLLLVVNSRHGRKVPNTISSNHIDIPMHSMATDTKGISHFSATGHSDGNTVGFNHNSVVSVIDFVKSSFSDISDGSNSSNHIEIDTGCVETESHENHVDDTYRSDGSNAISCASEVFSNMNSQMDHDQTNDSTNL